MGRIGAGVRGLLWALTCALSVACGDDPHGTAGDEDDEDEALHVTSADVSSESAAALEAALCASYRDEAALAATIVSIRNDRVSPIYLARALGHHSCEEAALFAVARDGVALDVHGFSDCEHRSCERLQDETDDRECVDRCDDVGLLTRLEPGATIDAGVVDGEYMGHGYSPFSPPMPARCLAGDELTADAAVACVSKHALAPGHYRLSARAFASLECDGKRSCECERSSPGWCLIDRRHRRRGSALEAALDLELPAERATLVFRDP